MRMIFGVLSLLVALAIVGSIAKKQLQAISSSGVTTRTAGQMGSGDSVDRTAPTAAIPGGMPAAIAADPNATGVTVRQQAQNFEQKILSDTNRAIQQGVERNAKANP
jgi:hypothetical protein